MRHGKGGDLATGERHQALRNIECRSASVIAEIALEPADPVYRPESDRDAGDSAGNDQGEPILGVSSGGLLGSGHEQFLGQT
jgi:hypothetical protein